MDTSKKTKKATTRKKSLAEYLAATPEIRQAEQSAIDSANRDYLRSLSTYGQTGELLASLGLSKSGYGEYLSGLAYADRQERIAKAKAQKADSLAKGYSAYLSGYEKDRASREKSAISAIVDQGISDENQAYDMAVGHGLSHGDALRVSDMSVGLSKAQQEKDKEALKKQLLQKMISYGFAEADGTVYAQSYGLPQEEAKALAKLALQLYRAKNMGMRNASYLDILEYTQQP